MPSRFATICLLMILVVVGGATRSVSANSKATAPRDNCTGFPDPTVPILTTEPFVFHSIPSSVYFMPGVIADWDGDGDLDLQYAENLGRFDFRYVSAIDDLVTGTYGSLLARNARRRLEVYKTIQQRILSGTYYNFHGVATFNFTGDILPGLILAPYYDQGIPIMMFHNLGNWHFQSVFGDYLRTLLGWTPESTWYSETISLGDLTGDGRNDIYIPLGHAAEPHQAAFLRNTGNGFVEEAIARGIGIPNLPISERPEGTQIVDIDDDGDLDLYVSHFLFINDGNGNFTDAREAYGLPYLTADEGVAFIDYDNDGLLDLYLRSGYADQQLFRNTGPSFVNATVTSGLACLTQNLGYFWGDSWADFNNDGYLDLLYISDYPTDPQYHVFLNQGDGTFKLGYTGHRFMHLSATADFNRDGAMDVFAQSEIYGLDMVGENKVPLLDGATALAVVPVDDQGRQSEYGATIRLSNNCNNQIQTRVAGANHVYLSQGEYAAHFAVASGCTCEISVAFVKKAGEERQIVTVPYDPASEKALRILVSRNSYAKQPYSGYQYALPYIGKGN